jgi:putative peptidoglycan lipid II flippase
VRAPGGELRAVVAGYACQEIFNRVYYALKKFRIPAQVSLLCIGLKLVLDYTLFRTAGITGISLSTAACLLVYAIIMGALLYKEIGSFINRDLFYFMVQLLLPTAGLCLIVIGYQHYWPVAGKLTFILPLALSGLVYVGIAWFSPVRKSILGWKEN